MSEHLFEPHGARMICHHCGLIMHRGNEVTPCPGPQLLAGRWQLGHPPAKERVSEPVLLTLRFVDAEVRGRFLTAGLPEGVEVVE